jgi:cysteine desulfurase
MHREIYLDNSATTKPYDKVIEYINYINSNIYGNPSSLHTKGIEAEKLIKKARESIALSLKVSEKEVIFTSGGTESNNLAIQGFLEANPRKGKHLITTKIEHPSVLEVYKHLSQKGYEVDFLEVDTEGIIQLEKLKSLIRSDTALISIIYINNETGAIQKLEEVIPIIKALNKEVVIHVDGVQAYGKIDISPKKLGIDLLAISSHKIHGPKGVGALYANKNIKLKPILLGGGQEALLRSGTENVSGICGFGLAAEIINKDLELKLSNVKKIKSFFLNNLINYVENYDIISSDTALPYILNIAFEGLRAEVLLHHLEEKNIFVSTGSACSSRKNVYSHVLSALGLDPRKIEGAIRFSFSANNTEDDISETLKALKEIVPKIKMKKRH